MWVGMVRPNARRFIHSNMSIRTVILSLVMAISLGGAAWYLLSRPKEAVAPGSIAPGALVVEIDPGAVRAVRITGPDGAEQVLERGAVAGTWFAVIGKRGGETRWAVQATAAQALLRRLAETRAIGVPTKEDLVSGVGTEATEVRVELGGGGVGVSRTQVLRFAARTLGDRGLVSVEPMAGADSSGKTEVGGKPVLAVVDSSLHKVLREPGPKGWREVRVFADLGSEVSRIRLANVDRNMTIGKVRGSWAMIEPVATAADPERVRQLVSMLGELSIQQFFDEQAPPTEVTGLDAPIVTITIESDRVDGGGGAAGSRTEARELHIGKPSDGTMQRRYAAYAKGGPVFTIGSTTLTQEVFVPTRYIAARSVESAVGDSGGVILEPVPGPEGTAGGGGLPARVFKRSLEQWVEIAGGKETAVSEVDGALVNEMLSFFTGEGPRTIELSEPAGWTTKGEITMLSLGGGPLAVLTIGSTGDGSLATKSVDAKRRGVYRVYSPGRTPGLFSGLAAELKRAAEASGGAKPGKHAEIMK